MVTIRNDCGQFVLTFNVDFSYGGSLSLRETGKSKDEVIKKAIKAMERMKPLEIFNNHIEGF